MLSANAASRSKIGCQRPKTWSVHVQNCLTLLLQEPFTDFRAQLAEMTKLQTEIEAHEKQLEKRRKECDAQSSR